MTDDDDIVATLYRRDSRRVLSTLIRVLGSFDLAEEALHDAFVAASERWPKVLRGCRIALSPFDQWMSATSPILPRTPT